MTVLSDADLYRRGAQTLLASWEKYARGATGAVVRRSPGVATAVFPNEPERAVYNNALLERDLAAADRARTSGLVGVPAHHRGAARLPQWCRSRRLPRPGRTPGWRERRDCDGVGSRRRLRDLQRHHAGACPAARTGHRADRRPRARRAGARMSDGELAVDGDGRARVRGRGLPRSRPDPRVRAVGVDVGLLGGRPAAAGRAAARRPTPAQSSPRVTRSA